MHTAKRTVAALAALLLASCAGDLGNYDYHALTEPVITGIDSEISVLTHARLELRPDLGEHEFPEDKYAFEWRAVSQNDNPAMTLLAETRDLEYDVELLPGSYLLLFRVIERASGVFWQAEYNLQVSESTSEGWMILCAEGAENRARLDMVSKVTGETYLDVLSGNGMPEMRNPYRIQWSRFADGESPYYLLTGDGATRLGRSGFEWKEEYRLQYEMGNSDIPAPEAVNDVTAAKMMVADGKVYYAECLVGIGLFGPVSGAAFHAAPVIGTNISTQNIVVPAVMLYDLDNKRFVGYAPNLRSDDVGGYEALHEMNDLVTLLGEMDNGGTVIGSAFERFPQGKEFVWMENTKYDPNNTGTGITYTLLRDGGEYSLYGTQLGEMWSAVSLGGPAFALGRAAWADLSACPEIAQASQFAFSSLRSMMYYAVGGTLYAVDLSQSPVQATRQFSLPGEEITCLKFNIYRQNENLDRTYDLVVGSVKGEEGTLRIYEGFDSDGDFRNVTPETHTGLGRIVDITYREMLK